MPDSGNLELDKAVRVHCRLEIVGSGRLAKLLVTVLWGNRSGQGEEEGLCRYVGHITGWSGGEVGEREESLDR